MSGVFQLVVSCDETSASQRQADRVPPSGWVLQPNVAAAALPLDVRKGFAFPACLSLLPEAMPPILYGPETW